MYKVHNTLHIEYNVYVMFCNYQIHRIFPVDKETSKFPS